MVKKPSHYLGHFEEISGIKENHDLVNFLELVFYLFVCDNYVFPLIHFVILTLFVVWRDYKRLQCVCFPRILTVLWINHIANGLQ